MEYIAHKSKNGTVQTVAEHSRNVADLAARFSVNDLKDICGAAGLYHDIGKYQPEFQARIDGSNIQVEHSICGAKAVRELYEKDSPLWILLALVIAGHHSGLPDCGCIADTPDAHSLYGRLKRNTGDYNVYKDELNQPTVDSSKMMNMLREKCRTQDELIEAFAFLVRYCFSCITDADTIDTMRSMDIPVPEPMTADFPACLEALYTRLASFHADTPIRRARKSLQKQAFENIGKQADIYLMEMPTGSGKTLASIGCALRKAIETRKKRIIYVIPYNSIIDQTAAELEKLFAGKAQIFRHQSSFSYENKADITESERGQAMFACENWDAQIIITTAVQFFESVYGNKRAKLRKLHNMADSVIVFDEAHMMPTEFLQPCLRAVSFITAFLNSQALFLTATMPDFKRLVAEYAMQKCKVEELITDRTEFIHFKKCTYANMGRVSDKAVILEASRHASSLIVVNARKTVRDIYMQCRGKKFHLSTYMTGLHRQRVIASIRKALDDLRRKYPGLENVPEEERIVVVSTSLVEAGVDLDFTAVFRELAGLDNYLQTMGRCNREGLLKNGGTAYIFERADKWSGERIEQNILRGIIRECDDISRTDVVRIYYNRLLTAKKEEIEENSLWKMCGTSIDTIPFREHSEKMKLIDSDAVSIVVSQDEKSEKLIREGRIRGWIKSREVQNYCCSAYPYELEKLIKYGAIENIGDIPCLSDSRYYSEETGLVFN